LLIYPPDENLIIMRQTDTLADILINRSNTHTFLLCCGVGGSLLFTFVYFAYGAIAPDYNIMRQSIGDLELLREGWIQSANFIVFAFFNFAFAEGLRREMVNGFGTTLIPLTMVATSVGLVLLGMFAFEPAHTLAGCIALLSIVCSCLLLSLRFAGDERWKGWSAYTMVTAILMSIFFIMYAYTRHNGSNYAGVYERLGVVTRLVWTFVLTIRLLDGRRMMQ
jgi:hypothetical protein